METNKEKRKQIPLYSGLIKYFPDALCEVAWDREKSKDDLDALMRHLMENGMHDIDGVRHSAKIAWRALAHLQKEIEGDKTDARTEQWYIDQYNRNRLPHDQIISGTE
jgi:hypothetical protein